MKDLQEYIANADGWVAGQRRKKGDPVMLTGGQAKYEDVVLKADAKYEDDTLERVEKARTTTKKKAS